MANDQLTSLLDSLDRTNDQLTSLLDSLDRVSAAFKDFSLTEHSRETSSSISAGGVTPKPSVKVTAPRRQGTNKTTLSRRK